MALVLLEPSGALRPDQAQAILAAAPAFLKSQKGGFPYPLSLFMSNESQEQWVSYENILLASVQTGDFKLAKDCVDALTERFGKTNERIIILQGLYDEATAADDNALRAILKRYDDIIHETPTLFGVHKRRIALLKTLGRTSDAVNSLVALLDASPLDAEAWMELSELYEVQGSLEQAIFCLEEVLLVTPNAWNVQAKLGEVLYLSAKDNAGVLSESARRFCRSAELSGQYLRAYYGLSKATTKLLTLDVAKAGSEAVLSQQATQKLQQLATSKLAEILRKSKADNRDRAAMSFTAVCARPTPKAVRIDASMRIATKQETWSGFDHAGSYRSRMHRTRSSRTALRSGVATPSLLSLHIAARDGRRCA